MRVPGPSLKTDAAVAELKAALRMCPLFDPLPEGGGGGIDPATAEAEEEKLRSAAEGASAALRAEQVRRGSGGGQKGAFAAFWAEQ
eukprot:297396-Prorocentrum_minimum.AAC.1